MKNDLLELLKAGYAITLCEDNEDASKFIMIVTDGYDWELTAKDQNLEALIKRINKRLIFKPD